MGSARVIPAERGPSGTGRDTPLEYDLTLNERIVGTYDTPDRAEEAKRWYVKTYGPPTGTFSIHERPPVAVPGPASVAPAGTSHRWVKAPRSLLAAYVCSRCGRDSMVKFYGRCSGGR